MTSILDLVNHVQQQGEIGRQQGTHKRLSSLMQQAYNAPRAGRGELMGQIAGTGGIEAASAAQRVLGASDDDLNGQLTKHAQMLVSLPPEQRAQAYPAVADLARKAGYPVPPGDWDERYMEGMQRLAGVSNQGPEGVVVNGHLVDKRTGNVMFRSPEQPKWHKVEGADGFYWVQEPGSGGPAAPVVGGAQGPTGGASAVLDGAYTGVMANVDPQIRSAIVSAAEKYGVPPEHLFALAEQESGFNPRAVNKESGAAGLFQYIPGTAKQHGIDPFDPVQAAEAAAKDWAARYRVGGLPEAAASHFAGPGGGNRGPKTRAYVDQMTERVERWGGGGGSGGVGAIPIQGVRPKPPKPEKEPGRFVTLGANEIKGLGLPAGTVAQRNDQTGQVQIISRPPTRPTITPGQPKPLGAEAANKVGLYDNAIRAAQQWLKVVVNPDGSYNDIAGRMPKAQALLNQALRAKLRAESGASISEAEIEGEMDRYGGGFLASDSTNAQKARALIADLQQQRNVLMSGQSSGPQPRAPAAAKPAGKPPTVTTKAQYDALPSGAMFIEDGQTYRKP